MASTPIQTFPPEVIERLKVYVYRLIDPRNGETFYVGKGTGNRVFAHVRDELPTQDVDADDKLQTIREIRLANLEVGHVIHRHGMDDSTAFEVEAALMDAYPGITNMQSGVAAERGSMHATQIISEYSAPEAVIGHQVLFICVNRSSAERSIYDSTRFAWRLNPAIAKEAEIILATLQGIIKEAFVADRWLEATTENFPGFTPRPGRYGFTGKVADEILRASYVGKRVPERFRAKGAANPIRYSWK